MSTFNQVTVGAGLVNYLINKTPVELHLPGYSYCGVGTKLAKRLERGDLPVNKLDEACRLHDIAYDQNKELSDRHKADKLLQEAAWERVKSKDSKFKEKAAALLVAGTMKVKRKLGMGAKMNVKRKIGVRGKGKRLSFRKTVITPISKFLKKSEKKGNVCEDNLRKSSTLALQAARKVIKKAGGRKHIRIPRIIPFENKSGGILGLLPIFAGLSAMGSLLGGSSAVIKTITDAKMARKKLEEDRRHNKTMEAIGSGLYLRKSKRGYGLFIKN